MVGLQPLELRILVRIQVPEPRKSRSRKLRLLHLADVAKGLRASLNCEAIAKD